jgi:hypothetical protein
MMRPLTHLDRDSARIQHAGGHHQSVALDAGGHRQSVVVGKRLLCK